MRGRNRLLAATLHFTGICRFLSQFDHKRLIVINYHRLHNDTFTTEFDDGAFGRSTETFDSQMRFLKKHTSILSEQDLIDCIKNPNCFPKRPALITFDDGYIDTYDIAFPILKYLNIPAILFIPTEAIESRKLGWWDVISYLVKRSSQNKITIMSLDFLITNKACKRDTIVKLLELMKTLSYSESRDLMQQLSSACRVPFPPEWKQTRELMTWRQIIEMDSHKIAIGSHTHTHRVLSTMEKADQLRELTFSKSVLEDKLKHEINSLAYPVGNYSAFSETTKRLAQRAGYSVAFSFGTGINHTSKIDPFDVRRVWAASPLSVFEASLLAPSVFLKRRNTK